MKKVYEQPILNIEVLESQDIITGSPIGYEAEGTGNTTSYNELF